jgi:hypothetical protein
MLFDIISTLLNKFRLVKVLAELWPILQWGTMKEGEG